MTENSLYVRVCVLRARRLNFFLVQIFFYMEGFCSGFSAFLPINNYKFKFKQTYVTCLYFESESDLFFANWSCRAFSDYRPSVCFCRLSSPIPTCEGSVFYQGAVTPMLEMPKHGSLIPAETYFLQTFG